MFLRTVDPTRHSWNQHSVYVSNINHTPRGHSLVKSSNHFVQNEEYRHKESQWIIRDHIKSSQSRLSRRFRIFAKRVSHRMKSHWDRMKIIRIIWSLRYWNHSKVCADDIINFWNNWNHSRNRLKSGTHWNHLYA